MSDVSKRLLFGHRLDAVEWMVLLIVCATVTVTLSSMSFEGPGVLFGGIPPGLGAVWLLRRVRPSLVPQPPKTAAPRGEAAALLSLLLFSVGALLAAMALLMGGLVLVADKPDTTFTLFPFALALAAVPFFYVGARLRRGS